MTFAFKIIVVVVALAALAVLALRVRKLRRDEMRRLSRPTERRLMTPPPSPYAPSRGFRLLDESGVPVARPPVERPRLDPERPYVFGESAANGEELVAGNARHDDQWFLTRSSHRSTLFLLTRRIVVVLFVALVLFVVLTYALGHHGSTGPGDVTTTTAAVLARVRAWS